MASTLVGYLRRSSMSATLKMSISSDAIAAAPRSIDEDGRRVVVLMINSDKVKEVIRGIRSVTSVVMH